MTTAINWVLVYSKDHTDFFGNHITDSLVQEILQADTYDALKKAFGKIDSLEKQSPELFALLNNLRAVYTYPDTHRVIQGKEFLKKLVASLPRKTKKVQQTTQQTVENIII